MDRYFIVKIEIKQIENSHFGIFYKKLNNNRISAIILDQLSDKQLLKVVLIQSENNINQAQITEPELSILLFEKLFTSENINKFLEESGDNNTIHFGENAVVPGIMVLDYFFRKSGFNSNFFSIKFFNPLLLQTTLQIYKRAENEYVGISNGQLIFKLV